MSEEAKPEAWWARRWPWHAIVASLVVGALYPLANARRDTPVNTRAAVILGAWIAVWLFFSAFTWRRLSRTRSEENARIVYDRGVIGWGIPFTIIMAVVNAVRGLDSVTFGSIFSLGFAASLLAHAFILFPIALWGGYGFGRAIGSMFRR
jgi:hypothetical protein